MLHCDFSPSPLRTLLSKCRNVDLCIIILFLQKPVNFAQGRGFSFERNCVLRRWESESGKGFTLKKG